MSITSEIENAIRSNSSLRISYRKFDGTTSNRTISNIEYSEEYGDEYIYAYCHLRNEYRTFKISRIISINKSNYNNTTNYKSNSYNTISSTTYKPNNSQSSKRNEGCYIATMAYGDYDHPQVIRLRFYRDEVLLKSYLGRLFVKTYYFTSPKLVILLKNNSTINSFIRRVLDIFITHKKL